MSVHPSHPKEFNNSLPELLGSDDDSGNEDVLDMEYTEAEAEILKRNAEVRHPAASQHLHKGLYIKSKVLVCLYCSYSKQLLGLFNSINVLN